MTIVQEIEHEIMMYKMKNTHTIHYIILPQSKFNDLIEYIQKHLNVDIDSNIKLFGLSIICSTNTNDILIA